MGRGRGREPFNRVGRLKDGVGCLGRGGNGGDGKHIFVVGIKGREYMFGFT